MCRMYRRLHNSLVALLASAALLVVGLLVATPVQRQAQAPAIAAAVADAIPAGTTRASAGGQPRHRGHALRMPFFSFAARN